MRVATAVLAATLGVVLLAEPAYAATFPINEPFTGAATNNPDWVFTDFAHLTDENPGWLQLTNTGNFVAGSATLNDAFPATLGIVVNFQYATYGGPPGGQGDGFSFFLMDGSFQPSLGISGGGLGYTQMQGGYAGVGFDEFGNYSAGLGGPGFEPNHIAIRGAYNATTPWGYLTGAAAPGGTVTTGDRAGVRDVRIVISPGVPGQVFMSVMSNTGPGTPLVPVIAPFDVTQSATGQPALPSTFKLGFAGSTGGAVDFHEIRNLTVNVPTDLALTKTATPNVNPGQKVTYTLTATNQFVNPVSNAIVTDTAPAGVTGVTWTCAAGTGGTCKTASGSGNDVAVPVDLDPGGTVTVTVTGTASAGTAGTTVTNTATIVPPPDRQDLDPTDATDSASTDVAPFADLAITKTLVAPSPPLIYGDTASYHIHVTNTGPGPASGVVVTDQIPAAIDPTSVTATGCTRAGTTLTCPVGDLAVGESADFTVTGTVSGSVSACTSGLVTQTASVDSETASRGVPDSTVRTRCVVPVSLTMTKTGPATATVGDKITYTLTATNTGEFAAPGTVINDQVSPAVSNPHWTCAVSDGSACTPASGSSHDVSTTMTIPAGGTATVTLTGTPTAAGTLSNTAVVDPCHNCIDNDPDDNSATVSTDVAAPPLPVTGPPAFGLAAAGGAIVLAGGVLILVGRRRVRR
jgi:uncharacterized repeat protein (TIGR01451 family)